MSIKLRLLCRGFAISLLLLAPALYAGSLDNSVIGLFPKDVGQFAYLNMAEARQLTWFAQFQQQVLPASVIGFEQFVSAAGINPNSQIDQIAWAYGSAANSPGGKDTASEADNGMIGVITGHFDPDSAQSAFQASHFPNLEISRYTLYSCAAAASCGDLYFFFLDSETAAFGNLEMLRKLIDVKEGSAESVLSNMPMYALIDQVNGDATFWDVSDSGGAAQLIRHLAPEASVFPQSSAILGSLKSLTTTVETSSDTDIRFQIVCASVNDSVFLSQALQAEFVIRKYQAGEEHPALATMLGETSIVAAGDALRISIDLSSDQLTRLIEEDTFTAKL
jgi:hypothetical protein